MAIKALVIDDHPMIAESIKSICLMSKDISNVDCINSMSDIQGVTLDSYHLFIVDIEVGHDDGRDLIRKIRKISPDKLILVFSSHRKASVIHSAYRAGSNAYLLKTANPEEILQCISQLLAGHVYHMPEVQQILDDHMRGKGAALNSNFPDITKREKEVLQLIVQELTSKEIALKLHLSEHTIEGHRASLFKKFDVKNIAGLVRKAIDSGMV